MNKKEVLTNEKVQLVIKEIKTILDTSRANVARQVNSELLSAYWNIGRIICEYEQSIPDRADYGKQTLKELSRALTQELGKGFSRSNLQNMRQFYLTYQKCQTLSGKLKVLYLNVCCCHAVTLIKNMYYHWHLRAMKL